MHRTFTSGAARRNEITRTQRKTPFIWRETGATRLVHGVIDHLNDALRDRVNGKHDQLGHINPILDAFRDSTYEGDPDLGYQAHEWLFQLARHWSEWQSPRIGTFPLDYRDPAGPVDREESEDSGEDRAYWEIDDAVRELFRGVTTITEGDGHWTYIGRASEIKAATHAAQDAIVHATAVLTRILAAHPID